MERGLEGASKEELLDGYCNKLLDLGVPLMRFHAAQSALHPVYGGTGFSWYQGQGGRTESFEYSDEPIEQWRQSPLYAILNEDIEVIRERLIDQNEASRFPLLNDLRQAGATDYFATGVNFDVPTHNAPKAAKQNVDGVLLSWTSNAPNGFQDADLDLINAALPHLGLALKSAASARVSKDLMRVYLVRDAGRRV